MPLFIKNRDGGDGMTRRQCTSEYKLKPIKEKTREILGAEPREDGKAGRVPKGAFAEQWVGISTDEIGRALDQDGNLKTGDVKYSRNRYPLLELDMDREKCRALLTAHGFGATPKSACIGCPFHSNMQWRELRDKSLRSGRTRLPLMPRSVLGRLALMPRGSRSLGRRSFTVPGCRSTRPPPSTRCLSMSGQAASRMPSASSR